MLFIRQGATHKVVLGPAVAVANGYVPVTSLTVSGADEAEAILHDNGTVVDISGYTWAAITTADGYYHLTLQSGISGTVGHVTVVVNDDSLCLPLRQDFTVVEEAVYDQLFAASAPGAATVAALATAQTDLDTLTGSDGATLATAQGNYAPAKAGDLMGLANDAITAAKYDESTAFPITAANGSQFTEAGGDGDHLTAINLPDQTMNVTGNITGNLSGSVGSVTGAVGSVTGAVGSVTGAVGSVTAGVTLANDAVSAAAMSAAANAEIAAAVLAAADANPIAANAKEVNDVALGGTGVLGDEWGPA